MCSVAALFCQFPPTFALALIELLLGLAVSNIFLSKSTDSECIFADTEESAKKPTSIEQKRKRKSSKFSRVKKPKAGPSPSAERGTLAERNAAYQARHRARQTPTYRDDASGQQRRAGKSQEPEAIRKREYRARQQAAKAEEKAATATQEAEYWKAEAAKAHRLATEKVIELLKTQASLDKALAELEELAEQLEVAEAETPSSEPDPEQLETKQGSAYRSDFQLMCCKLVFAGVPQCHASYVIRAVLEWRYKSKLPKLQLPSRKTHAGTVQAGARLAEAVGAKIVSESQDVVVLHIDATSKLGRTGHGGTLTVQTMTSPFPRAGRSARARAPTTRFKPTCARCRTCSCRAAPFLICQLRRSWAASEW